MASNPINMMCNLPCIGIIDLHVDVAQSEVHWPRGIRGQTRSTRELTFHPEEFRVLQCWEHFPELNEVRVYYQPACMFATSYAVVVAGMGTRFGG